MTQKKVSLGQLAELLSMRANSTYSTDQLAELVNRCANGTYDADFVQALIEKRLEIVDGCIVGYRRIPVLSVDEGGRRLCLSFFADEWSASHRLLFVRE